MGKDQTYDHLVKLLIVGNSGVGKTNMLLRFCENNFLSSHLTTIGIDFKTKTILMDQKKIRLQIWDTAGQQRFKTITQTYYRGAMGIFMVYAIDDKQSFYQIENWAKQIKNNASQNVVQILIGNKSDSNRRQISVQEGQKMAKELGVPFFETSAKLGNNIDDCFMLVARTVKQIFIDNERDSRGISFTPSKLQKDQVNSKQNKKKQKNCCQ